MEKINVLSISFGEGDDEAFEFDDAQNVQEIPVLPTQAPVDSDNLFQEFGEGLKRLAKLVDEVEESQPQPTEVPVSPKPVYELQDPVSLYNAARAQWKYAKGTKVYIVVCNPSPIRNSFLVVKDGEKFCIPYATLGDNDTPLCAAQKRLAEILDFVPGAADCALNPSDGSYTVDFTHQYPICLERDPEDNTGPKFKWVDSKEIAKIRDKQEIHPDYDNVDRQSSYTSFNAVSNACRMLHDPNFYVANLIYSQFMQNRSESSEQLPIKEIRSKLNDAVEYHMGRKPISESEFQQACAEILFGEE